MDIDVPVIGILRGVDGGFFAELMQASFAAGLQAIEVTMNTPGAEKMVAACRPKVGAGRYLGVGTIRSLEEARRAVDCGAMFMVSPNLDPAVIEYGGRHGIPVVSGALTPTEVYAAMAAGADLVKVFPCNLVGGAEYIRALRGPFEQAQLVAVGGVTLENVPEYLAAGARAVGVSSELFGRRALQTLNIEELARNVANFVQHCLEAGDRL